MKMDNEIKQKIIQLVQAYDEYINVLNDELNDTIGMASIHGWQSRNVKRGEDARYKMGKAKLALLESGSEPEGKEAVEFAEWMRTHNIRTLNVAGPRESKQSGIGKETKQALADLFAALTPQAPA